jgi:hypothetical protein
MMVSAQSADTNGFPSELDDRGWLAAHYRSLGDETVAAELRVSRKSVQRARERLGIAGNSHANGNGHTNGSGSGNGNGASNGAHARPMLAAVRSTDTTGRPFVSDEELTRRVARVKKSLADTCAGLVRAINELEWVRQQVAPPDQQQSRRAA